MSGTEPEAIPGNDFMEHAIIVPVMYLVVNKTSYNQIIYSSSQSKIE